jgi:methylenetetrahydrofolate dehydrogenase (NADP+)/methenyltetrahydrofolate cyclohydrolase
VDLDGTALAHRLRDEFAPEVDRLLREGRRPRLVAVQVGTNPATEAYIRGQRRGAEAWRIQYDLHTLPGDATEPEVRAAIETLNASATVTGILLQLPLPPHLPGRPLQLAIAPEKDVEGVTPTNLGALVHGRDGLAPCTALASIALLESSHAVIRGADAVVVGHSDIVGKPVALLLLARDATTHVCHKFTKDLARHTREADLLVVAVGRPNLVTPDMVRPGAVVVDVGINVVPDPDVPGKTRVVGDVDRAGLLAKGCRVSPVPGGVGPVTVAMLMRNTILAARKSPPPREEISVPLFPDS